MIIKVEYLLDEDIHIGAMIYVTKKNTHPIIVTDLNGGVLGYNKQVDRNSPIRPSN